MTFGKPFGPFKSYICGCQNHSMQFYFCCWTKNNKVINENIWKKFWSFFWPFYKKMIKKDLLEGFSKNIKIYFQTYCVLSLFLVGQARNHDLLQHPILNCCERMDNEIHLRNHSPWSILVSPLCCCRFLLNNSGKKQNIWGLPSVIHTLLHSFHCIDSISTLKAQEVLKVLNYYWKVY